MSQKRYSLAKEAEERWPKLWNALGAYFHQDYQIIDGSVEAALERIIADYPTDHRREILKEWRAANSAVAWKGGFDRYLGDAFGVAIRFDGDVDARRFWNRFYDKLIESVRVDTAP